MSKRRTAIKIGDNVKGTRLENIAFSGYETPIEVGHNSDVTLENVSIELPHKPKPTTKEKRKG